MKEVVSLAKKLISFPTIAENLKEKHRCIDFVMAYLKGTGLKLKKLEFDGIPSLVISFDGKKKQRVWMNGHLDVVPADMYKGVEKKGRLYGRGSLDMKTGAAAAIVLMKELSTLKKKLSVGLMLVTDEEIGGVNGSKKLMQLGYTSDFLICCESTDLNIINKGKGILGLELTAKAKATHGAHPWQGVNAIEQFYAEFQKFKKMFKDPMKLGKNKWVTTYSLNMINSGTAHNKVPDECAGYVDIRHIDNFDKMKFVKRLKKETGFKVDVKSNEPIFFTDEKNQMFNKFLAIAKKHNPKCQIKHMNGATDTRFFTMPAGQFGPSGKGMHAEEEYVDIKSVKTAYNVWKEFILSL
ncbi:M20/M25/M40 family metallo-hydrolase [Candidatus Woesearchaeota archaeon]|nr:M20/M25/M40 family metallo-hydrolase [Candidatus Woesearchaeota archaeon]